MTSGWFMTLGSIWERTPMPLRLFSVDRCFRREQAEGPTRRMTYHSASCIIAGDDITLDDGKAVSQALLSAFGYSYFRSSRTRNVRSIICLTPRLKSTPGTRFTGWWKSRHSACTPRLPLPNMASAFRSLTSVLASNALR